MVQESFRGYASQEAKAPLETFEYAPKPLGDSDVEVRISHNGLCHTDLHMRDNEWGISSFPLCPGHEVIGVIEAKGAGVGDDLPIGTRVGLGWIRDSCGSCDNCIIGQENICTKGYTGTIVGHHGGFQDRVRVSAKFAFKIPDSLDSVSAAPLMCAGATIYTPLRTYVTKPGMKVGVIGIGGLGHLAVQFARAMGCEVTAFSTTPSKEAEARAFGAHHFALLNDPKYNNTQDLLLNTSPYDMDWSALLNLLKLDGKLCLLGIPATTLTIPVIPVVFHQKSVVGSIVAGRKFMREMLEFAGIHGIKPQTETMPLEKVNEAMDRVAKNEARYRIVLVSEEN
ncbi:hypothetical protein HDV00_002324 [Rhizophlyctis rosea]|nr:hypothetical protein HDV00_002324 [Rhizophlyctis rosea]